MSTKLTVFYNGACPLCVREIKFYRRFRGSDDVIFTDINQIQDDLVAPGLTKEAATERLHVLQPDGRVSSGGVALAHLWAALPALSGLGRFFLRKPWPCVLDAAYTVLLPTWPLIQRVLGLWVRTR